MPTMWLLLSLLEVGACCAVLTSSPLSLTRGRRPFLFFFSSSCAALALQLEGAVITSLQAQQQQHETQNHQFYF